MHSVWIFYEARQFSLRRLENRKIDHLLLDQDIFDGVQQDEEVETVVGAVVMVDARLSDRPRHIR